MLLDLQLLVAAEVQVPERIVEHVVVEALRIVGLVSQERFVELVQRWLLVCPMSVEGLDRAGERVEVDSLLTAEGLQIAKRRVDIGKVAQEAILEFGQQHGVIFEGLEDRQPVTLGQVRLLVHVELTKQLE